MIVKERRPPLILLKLEALLRRLPNSHSSRHLIEKDYLKVKAGFNGEKKIDYYLGLLPQNEFSILHNIRLKNEQNHFFQIDTILISSKFVLLIEVKNMLGNIIFERDFNQFIRIHNQSEESFPNPLLQVEYHQRQISSFFQKQKLIFPPIHTFIIISNSSSVIKSTLRSTQVLENVFHAELLPSKIKQLNNIETKQLLSSNQIRKITKIILKNHTTLNSSVLERYNLTENDIMKGVICPNCLVNKMKRVYGKWYCKCSYISKDAHIQAIRDYAYLICPTMSNQHVRDFLQLSSTSVASKLLKSLNLDHSGHTKGRKYLIEMDD